MKSLRVLVLLAVAAVMLQRAAAQTVTITATGTIYSSYTYLGTGLTSIIPLGSTFTATWVYDVSTALAPVPAAINAGVQVATRYEFTNFTTTFTANGYTFTTPIGSGGAGIIIYDNTTSGYDGIQLIGRTSGGTAPTQNTFYLNSISLQLLNPNLSTFTDQALSHVSQGSQFTVSAPVGATNMIIISGQTPENITWGTELDGYVSSYTYSVAAVPEPATYGVLAGVGALGLALWARRRRSRALTAAVAVTAGLALARSASAQVTFTDDFSSAATWTPGFSDSATLSVASGRAGYSTATTADSAAVLFFNAANFSYASNWSAQVDVHAALASTLTGPGNGYFYGSFVVVRSGTDLTLIEPPTINLFSADIVRNGSSENIFQRTWWVAGEDYYEGPAAANSSSNAALRVTFDSATKVLTAFYDNDGATGGYNWTSVGSLAVGGAGGWGMGNADTFALGLAVFAGGQTISPSEAYFDNLSASAVPEPSTYAVLAGLGALGLVLWHRRRRAVAAAS